MSHACAPRPRSTSSPPPAPTRASRAPCRARRTRTARAHALKRILKITPRPSVARPSRSRGRRAHKCRRSVARPSHIAARIDIRRAVWPFRANAVRRHTRAHVRAIAPRPRAIDYAYIPSHLTRGFATWIASRARRRGGNYTRDSKNPWPGPRRCGGAARGAGARVRRARTRERAGVGEARWRKMMRA